MFFLMAKDVLIKNLAYPIVKGDGVQYFCHRPTPPPHPARRTPTHFIHYDR